MVKTHEVNTGDIYIEGNSFFRVTRIWEGRHPTMDGAVFHLEVFRMSENRWTPCLPYFAKEGKDFNVLTGEALSMAGFAN